MLKNYIVAAAVNRLREIQAGSYPALKLGDEIHQLGREYVDRYCIGTLQDLDEKLDAVIVAELTKELASIMTMASVPGVSLDRAAATLAALTEMRC